MKKTLLICFLASLCLFGSTLTAQVADSPGADFLHRSSPSVPFGLRDTHRGGETRSDTLPEQNGLVDHSVAKGQEGESSSASVGEAASVVIYGEIVQLEDADSLTLQFWPILYAPSISDPGPQVWTSQANATTLFQTFDTGFDRQFGFIIPEVSQPGYISLSMGNKVFLDTYLVSPGDSMMVRIDRMTNTTTFTGPSAPLFRCQQELKQLYLERKLDSPILITLSEGKGLNEKQQRLWEESQQRFGRKSVVVNSHRQMLDYLKDLADKLDDQGYLDILERYRNGIPDPLFSLLKAGSLAKERYKIPYAFFKYEYPAVLQSGDGELIKDYREFYTESVQHLDDFIQEEDLLALSYDYMRLREALVQAKAVFRDQSVVDVAEEIPSVAIRGKLLSSYFLQYLRYLPDWESLLSRAISMSSIAPYNEVLSELYFKNLAGSEVPDLPLLTLEGTPFSLQTLKGKVILVEFWLSGCKACLGFRPDLIRIAEEFSPSGEFAIVSVPIDKNPEHWTKALASGAYDLPNQITLHTGGQGSSHPFPAYYNINAFPHVLIIDQQGKLVRSGVYRNTYDYVATELQKLLYTDSEFNKESSSLSNYLKHNDKK